VVGEAVSVVEATAAVFCPVLPAFRVLHPEADGLGRVGAAAGVNFAVVKIADVMA